MTVTFTLFEGFMPHREHVRYSTQTISPRVYAREGWLSAAWVNAALANGVAVAKLDVSFI